MSSQQEIRTFKVVIKRETEDGMVTRKHTMHGVNQSEIIKTIKELPDRCFDNQDDTFLQKNILISKILVLEEIRKDW